MDGFLRVHRTAYVPTSFTVSNPAIFSAAAEIVGRSDQQVWPSGQENPVERNPVLFETVSPIPNLPSNFNAAPTQVQPVVRLDQEGRRSLDLLRWGLIPFWAKDAIIGARCINTMFETVAAKPVFRVAFRRGRRCLVPMDGFYEWRRRRRYGAVPDWHGRRVTARTRRVMRAMEKRRMARSYRPSLYSRHSRMSYARPSTIDCRSSWDARTGQRSSGLLTRCGVNLRVSKVSPLHNRLPDVAKIIAPGIIECSRKRTCVTRSYGRSDPCTEQ
jgi:hypothetical protein